MNNGSRKLETWSILHDLQAAEWVGERLFQASQLARECLSAVLATYICFRRKGLMYPISFRDFLKFFRCLLPELINAGWILSPQLEHLES